VVVASEEAASVVVASEAAAEVAVAEDTAEKKHLNLAEHGVI
jgi:hypothetical protein